MRFTAFLMILVAAGICAAGEPPAPGAGTADENDIEFRVNGEPVTKSSMTKSLGDCPSYNPDVCPTDMSAGWVARRQRLIRYIPLRQFLDAEGVKVPDEEITAEIERMKKEPNPFGKQPPKPISAVMVRDVITWDDLRLMLRVDIGLEKWAVRKWREKWPTDDAWKEHCGDASAAFENEFGKFSRISFSISRWPSGAKDEQDALRMLKTRADEAAKRLKEGAAFETVAKDPAVDGEIAAAQVLPHAVMGPDHRDTLKVLAAGETTDPLATRFSWEIFRRERLTPEDIAGALKIRFLNDTRTEAEKRVAADTKIEKVHWMSQEDLFRLGSGN